MKTAIVILLACVLVSLISIEGKLEKIIKILRSKW